MRKKLLRSRLGFEKPESREEAIMQNILGASNVLEPSESNIEEILKSILYNTPYTKEAEFEIEKILLAIKNNGTYTGECESRDMKILFAILNESTYNEEAESRIEELFIEWLYQRSSIKVLEGVPPLTFTSRGFPLINYLIEGNTVQNGSPQGVGEKSENLFDISTAEDTKYYINYSGNLVEGLSGDRFIAKKIRVKPSTKYTFSWGDTIVGTSDNSPYIRVSETANTQFLRRLAFKCTDYINKTFTITTSQYTTVLDIRYDSRTSLREQTITNLMINEGGIALPYEPYGYKIPVTCGGITTDIYIGDSPLYDADTISMADIGIEIPTTQGANIITVDTTVQPSNVYIEYK